MNKFNEILTSTGNKVLAKRSSIINEAALDQINDLVNKIEREIRELKLKKMELEDLSITSAESLVVGENFNAKTWVTKMFDIEDKLRDANIRLDLAKKIYTEYFEDKKPQ